MADAATDLMNWAGSGVNKYIGDVRTATASGAGNDLLGFIQNELTKYPGTQTAEPNAPGFDVANNVLLNLLSMTGLGNPVESASGPTGAVLGPVGRASAKLIGPGGAKAVNQAQKKIVKALFRADPKTLQKIVASPEMMHVGVPGAAGGLPKHEARRLVDEVMDEAFAHFQPSFAGGTVRVDPRVMRGIDPKPPRAAFSRVALSGKPKSVTLKEQGIEGLTDMATHEGVHFLNQPAIRNLRSGPDVARLAHAIEPFIGHTAFGNNVVRQFLGKGKTVQGLNEALSYLSQPSGRTPAGKWLHNVLTGEPVEGGIGQFQPTTQRLLQEALDAALRVPGIVRK